MGLTLVEILVALAIVIVLAAIAVSVTVRSRQKAMEAADISNLRQLGIARQVYSEEHGPVYGIQPLVNVGLVPTAICASPLDPTKEGFANRNESAAPSKKQRERLITSYKRSYVSLADYGIVPWADGPIGARMFEMVERGPAAGWLTEFGISDRNGFTSPTSWNGRYRRLLFDGSVVIRPFVYDDCGEPEQPELKGVPCRMTTTLFRDIDEEYRQWTASGGR